MRISAPRDGRRAFTLIELLIVVTIIAILAAIALPNFLEAQTRTKVARVQSDLRTIAVGLECYAADSNHYPPNDGVYNVTPIQLTTPVAFLTSALLADPFTDKDRHVVYGELARFYTYTLVVNPEEVAHLNAIGKPPPIEAVDGLVGGFTYNPGARTFYGDWRLGSNGPDRRYDVPGAPRDGYNINRNAQKGADIPYDPTNGTISAGNILRYQKAGLPKL